VVLVHGLSGSTRWWRPVIPALAARYRVYMANLPGFGSFRRRGPLLPLSQAFAWVEAWMRAVGMGRAHLVGHSMGGYIALRVAVSASELVDRLVLVDAAGLPVHASLLGRAPPLVHAGRRLAPTFLPVLAVDALRAGPLTLLRAGRDLLTQDVTPYLPEVAAPTLLIWGAEDVLVPLGHALEMRRTIPRSRLIVLPGAGHVPMYDRPEEFNRVLLSFLAGSTVGE
jgi:pimeloyl-ACP methyl ester carboxylesterase